MEVPDVVVFLRSDVKAYLKAKGLEPPYRQVRLDPARRIRIFEGIVNPCLTEDTEWP